MDEGNKGGRKRDGEREKRVLKKKTESYEVSAQKNMDVIKS